MSRDSTSYRTLLSSAAVSFLAEREPALLQELNRLESSYDLVDYPDGSKDFDRVLADKILPNLFRHNGDGLCYSHFRTLGPFSRRLYELWYTTDYRDRIGEVGFLMIPGGGPTWDPSPGEFNLEALPVTVFFHRKINKDMTHRFADRLHHWFQTVSKAGLLSEGPILKVSPEVEFVGRRAQFTIDASRSGINTINWLTLTLLSFGYTVATLRGIHYDMRHVSLHPGKDYVELYWGIERGKPIHVAIAPAPERHEKQPGVKKESPLPDCISPNTVPHAFIRSERFPVLVTPAYYSDSLEITVIFSGSPELAQQQCFCHLIESWLTLGQFGGLGGKGVHWAGQIRFNQEKRAAHFCADMGDADEKKSLELLTASLEGFASAVLPIEAVILGR